MEAPQLGMAIESSDESERVERASVGFVFMYERGGSEGQDESMFVCFNPKTRSSLERLVEADGGGAVEDYVDAGGELLYVLRADGQAGLRQLTADGDDLLVEVRVVLPHSVKQLPDT